MVLNWCKCFHTADAHRQKTGTCSVTNCGCRKFKPVSIEVSSDIIPEPTQETKDKIKGIAVTKIYGGEWS